MFGYVCSIYRYWLKFLSLTDNETKLLLGECLSDKRKTILSQRGLDKRNAFEVLLEDKLVTIDQIKEQVIKSGHCPDHVFAILMRSIDGPVQERSWLEPLTKYKVELLADCGEDLNRYLYENEPMIFTHQVDDIEIFEALIANGWDVNRTLFMFTVHEIPLIDKIIAESSRLGVDLEICHPSDNLTPIFHNPRFARRVKPGQVDVNVVDSGGNSLIHFDVASGRPDPKFIKHLINLGIDIDHQNKMGETALHLLVDDILIERMMPNNARCQDTERDLLKCLQVLLDAGADTKIRSDPVSVHQDILDIVTEYDSGENEYFLYDGHHISFSDYLDEKERNDGNIQHEERREKISPLSVVPSSILEEWDSSDDLPSSEPETNDRVSGFDHFTSSSEEDSFEITLDEPSDDVIVYDGSSDDALEEESSSNDELIRRE